MPRCGSHGGVTWCLTTCIAADVAGARLLKEMETGHKLLLEVVDSNVLTVATTLPIDRFAMVRRGTPEQTFKQAISEGHSLCDKRRPPIYARPADAFSTGSSNDFAANGFVR